MKKYTSAEIELTGLAFVLIALFAASCQKEKNSGADKPAAISYKIRNSWPHDPESFIQGLVIHEGKLYESTGQEKKSWVGIVDIKTGKPDKKVILDDQYFGEGITVLNNKVYHLTYKSKVGFVYDLKTFEKLREFNYTTEGWGITHDSTNLIMSDGTDKLTFLDTATLKPVRTLNVTDENGPVKELNELEYVKGFILANQWQTNIVVKIDPASGKVIGRIDLTPLAQNARMLNPKVDVLNGIAYHSSTGLLLVTGKYWPKIYALQLIN